MSSSGKANAALAAAIVFLLLSSGAAYFAFARLRASQGWVQHTRNVQDALDQLSKTSWRASRVSAEYIDSGDASLLEREAQTVLAVRNALSSIQRLTADNVGKQVSYGKLKELAEGRISLIEKSIELKRSGRSTLESQSAMQRPITANAEAMDRLLQAMYADEERLLAERQQGEQSSFTVTVGILATSLFLALVLFLIHHQLLTDQVLERVRAESSLRALSARLLTLQDEERRKFARELHDSVGQQLVAMKMGISALQQKLPDDQIVEDCLKILDESIAETRTISHLLHPPLLDEAGLKSALRWFVEGFGKRSGIEVTILTQDGPERFPEAVELVLFRVLQESLTNVHRHSGATRADVSLSTEGNQVILRVKDHGCGIPDTVLSGLRDQGGGLGVGLAGMTQRIREIGGRLEINSGPSGTEITVAIPLEQKTQPRGTSSPAAQAVSG
jgi:signal transduction histidine kinase